MTKKTRVKSKRLLIEPLSADELSELIDSTADDSLLAAYNEMLSGVRDNPENAQWHTYWRIKLKDTGAEIGGVCFKGAPNKRHEIEIKYFIDEQHSQKGYATEALKVMSDWAFYQKDVYFIRAETDDGGDAYKRVLEKCKYLPAKDGDGRVYEREKSASYWLGAYLCIGLSIGLTMGTLLGNMAIFMCFSTAFGITVGAILDAADKKLRKRV